MSQWTLWTPCQDKTQMFGFGVESAPGLSIGCMYGRLSVHSNWRIKWVYCAHLCFSNSWNRLHPYDRHGFVCTHCGPWQWLVKEEYIYFFKCTGTLQTCEPTLKMCTLVLQGISLCLCGHVCVYICGCVCAWSYPQVYLHGWALGVRTKMPFVCIFMNNIHFYVTLS